MTQHLCNQTGEWADGPVVSCCGNHYGRSHLDRLTTNVTQNDSPPGAPIIRHQEHLSGQIDATIRPETIHVSYNELRDRGLV